MIPAAATLIEYCCVANLSSEELLLNMENKEKSVSGDIRIDEIMPELFSGWMTLPFEECLLDDDGDFVKLKQSQTLPLGNFPVIDQGEDLINGYVDNENLIYSGSLPVIIFGDHTRRLKFIDFKFAVGADGTKILKSKPFLNIHFFYYYLSSLQIASEGYSRHYKFLKAVDVPIPPLAEQHRIVAKLDSVLARVNNCKARLEKIPALLKNFRQSVLAAAVSGDLTKEWREKNTKGKSASDLLKEIQASRIKQYQEQLLEWKKGKAKKPKTPEDLQFTPLIQLSDEYPSNWAVTRVRDAADCLDYLRKPINKDERAKRIGEIPYYGANGQVGWIDDYLFNEDLVVIVEDETFLGREIPFSYIIRGKTWVNNHAHVMRPVGGISVEYLNICWSFYNFTPLTSGTTGRRKLTQGALMAAEFAIAPLEEQKEIVRKVEELFHYADSIEARYQKAKAWFDKLPQSILAKAFRGELVVQDGNDEPASELLAKINSQKNRKKKSYAN